MGIFRDGHSMNAAYGGLLPHVRHAAAASLVFLLALLSAGHVCAQDEPGLVSVTTLDSTIVLDMRYAGAENFVGTPIDGYEAPVCLLSRPAARALAQASSAARQKGYRLVTYDCYRPQRAVDHFVRWSGYVLDQKTKGDYYPNVDKRQLFGQGYIASRSGHSRASTVDVGLLRVVPGSDSLAAVDMGTPFDFFDPVSHTDSPEISREQRQSRLILLDVMKAVGFRNYPKEWWHFTLIDEPYPDRYFDIVVRDPRADR